MSATNPQAASTHNEIGSLPFAASRFSRLQAAASRTKRPWASVTLIESSRSGFCFDKDMVENGWDMR
jgi:hypothetical protein